MQLDLSLWGITSNSVERKAPTKSQGCNTVSRVEGIISNQDPSELWIVCWVLNQSFNWVAVQPMPKKWKTGSKQAGQRIWNDTEPLFNTKFSCKKKLEIIPKHLTGENMISFKVSFLGFLWLTVGWKVYIKCSFSPILVLLSWVVCYLPGFAQRVPFLCRFVSSLHIHYINSLSCSLWNVF